MIACITVPYFAASVENRDSDSGPFSPGTAPGLVLGGQPWEPQPVYAFSREAALKGIRSGMSLRLAHVISPEASFKAANPPRYYNTSGEITDILSDFTHLIEPEALWHPEFGQKQKQTASTLRLPARFNMDFEKLAEKEAVALVREIGKNIREKTWMNPAIGVAQNKFVAQIAASLTQPNHSRAVSPAETSHFLSSRSIHFLPLDQETSRRLSLLGIRTLGQLTALPLRTLKAQIATKNRRGYHHSIGDEFSTLYTLAKTGAHPSIVSNTEKGNQLLNVKPFKHDLFEKLDFKFNAPVSNQETIHRVLRRLAEQLCGRLQDQNLSCQSMELTLDLEGFSGEISLTMEKTTRHPTADPTLLTKILVEIFQKLAADNFIPVESQSEDHPIPGVLAMGILAKEISSSTAWQLSLFQPIKAAVKAVGVVENLITKHGSKWFFKPEPLKKNHPLPEQRFLLKELISV